MSWKLGVAAMFTTAGLVVAAPAQAGDVFKLALSAEGTAPTQALLLKGDADTVAVGGRGHTYHRAYYRPYYRGYAYYRYPVRYSPPYGLSFGFGYAPPAYYYAPAPVYYAPPVTYYTTPSYYAPMSLGVQTYSLPSGNVTYSVTRPGASGAERVLPPVPRDGTFPYDGGPANPVPMPRADPGPTSAPRQFHIAPLDGLRVSLPEETRNTATTGKFSYPAYGEEPRRGTSPEDRTIVIKGDKKSIR